VASNTSLTCADFSGSPTPFQLLSEAGHGGPGLCGSWTWKPRDLEGCAFFPSPLRLKAEDNRQSAPAFTASFSFSFAPSAPGQRLSPLPWLHIRPQCHGRVHAAGESE